MIDAKRFYFTFGGAAQPPGFQRISAGSSFTAGQGYGWVASTTLYDRDRGEPDALRRGLVLGFGPARLRLAVPSGRYRIVFVIGDTDHGNHSTRIRLPGQNGSLPVVAGKRFEFITLEASVEIGDDPFDIDFDSPGENWIVNLLTLEAEVTAGPIKLARTVIRPNMWKLPQQGPRGSRRLFEQWRQLPAAGADVAAPAGDRGCYLEAIRGCIGFFRHHQAQSGAILDPYLGREYQYSTPCFAFGAALLARAGGEIGLVEPASRALDHAIACLAERRTADHHADFFTLPIAEAIVQLDPLVPAEQSLAWRLRLSQTDPFQIYRNPVGGHDGPGINWNCLAAAGEFRLAAIGARNGLAFVDASLNGQGKYFDNEFGLYAEGPLVYDAFPRAWLADLPRSGYAGPAAADLAEALDRAAMASLFMQAPSGEAPIGGRSAHHQWADALQSATFEAAAARAARCGDSWMAGVFKRAARRAAVAMQPWRRESGEWFIVKNRAAPEQRHGYEPYSAHSQYNLLAATNLGLAWLHAGATEDVAERITPAEAGGQLLVLPPPFSSLVASCSGTQATFFLSPHANQTPAGLVRVQFDGLPSVMGPSDGIPLKHAFELPGGAAEPVSTGLAWREGERWTSLAHLKPGAASASVAIEQEDAALLRFALTWSFASGGRIVQHVQIRPGEVLLDFVAEGLGKALALRWPVFAGDGEADSEITTDAAGCQVVFRGARLRYSVAGADPVQLSALVAHRNGWVRIATAEATGTGPLRLVISRA